MCLVGVVVRRYIYTFPHTTYPYSALFGSSIPTFLFIFVMFFVLYFMYSYCPDVTIVKEVKGDWKRNRAWYIFHVVTSLLHVLTV